MAVVSDYNPGDLLTGTAGEGGDDENAVKDLSISDALVKTLASFADLQEGDLNPALINHTREITVKQEEIPALGHDFVNGECSRCDETLTSKFEDVPAGAFYFDPVEWAVEKGITTGATATTFNPNGDCQRAAVVTFLWRAAGCPEPKAVNNPFVDVKPTDFFYKAVLWAVECGITNGVDATHFDPTGSVSRAQMVAFLYRYAKSVDPDLKVGDARQILGALSDGQEVLAYDWMAESFAWAIENGVINGMDGKLVPGGTANRAQVAVMLYRFFFEQSGGIRL